jgi:hypothetical protein
MLKKMIDLTGQQFGRLAVLSRAGKDKHGNVRWNCVCSCGTEKEISGAVLRQGKAVSCGCFLREVASQTAKSNNTSHGMTSTPTYYAWQNMMTRCNNPNFKQYKDYGGRGIKVCERWRDFAKFYEDMGLKPEDASLDRKDNEGDYTPDNCRWATQEEQLYNRRSTIEWGGKTLLEWHKETGMNYYTMYSRIKRYGNLFPPQLEGLGRAKAMHFK